MPNSHPCRGAFAILFCGILCAGLPATAANLKPWTQGPAPALALRDMQGQPRSLDEFRGKVVVVNFWATWCEPCVEEMPSLQRFRDRLVADNFAVVGVNLGEAEARIKTFTDKTRTTFPILLDRDGVARKAWKVNGAPATFVLDGSGRVRYWYTGVLDFSDAAVTAPIERLLSGNPKK